MIFVVSTGRTGSFALGQALGALSGICVLQEALSSLDGPAALLASDLSQFSQQLLQPNVSTTTLLRGRLEPPEFLLPVDAAACTYDRSSGVPPLTSTTLPALGIPAEDAMRALASVIDGLEWTTARHSLQTVFNWLARQASAEQWVERSGGSLAYVGELVASYPTARFIHLHRDGLAVASSMERHAAFRLALARMGLHREAGVDLYGTGQTAPEATDLRRLCDFGWAVPDSFDYEAFAAWAPRRRDFLRLWAFQTVHGLRALRKLPDDQLMHLQYEALVSEPFSQLRRVSSFLGLTGRAATTWARSQANRFAPSKAEPANSPDRDERRLLEVGRKAMQDVQELWVDPKVS